MINKLVLSMLLTGSLFCAESKQETSTLIRPVSPLALARGLTPGAPRQSHRHMVITVDRDSPIPAANQTVQNITMQNPNIQLNRTKLKLAVVACVGTLVGAGISATVSLLSKKC